MTSRWDVRFCVGCDMPFRPARAKTRFCTTACRLGSSRRRGKRLTAIEQTLLTRSRSALQKAILREIKLKSGCADCGYRGHPAALEFDHVTGQKSFTIATRRDLLKIFDEIQKCEVVCSNCHRIRTFERGERLRIIRLNHLFEEMKTSEHPGDPDSNLFFPTQEQGRPE